MLSCFVCLLASATFISVPAAAADPALTASFTIRTQAPYPEGSSPVFTATVDGKRRDYTYVYEWNFGQGGGWEKRSLEPANLFFDNGNYPVGFRVTELRNGSQVRRVESAPRTITIQNVAPGGNITGAPAQSAEGVEITVNSTVSDAGRDDRGHLRRDWVVLGGPSSTGRAGSTSPRFIFTPTDSGNYTVAMDVTDKDGATTRITRSIHVGNEAPTGHAGGPYVAANGRPMQVLGTIDDASPADLAHLDVSWNFGDGTEPQSGLSPTHTYAAGVAPGRKNITMTITDPDGGTEVVNTWATLAAAPSFRQPNGIYSLSDNDGWLSDTSLASPRVDGVSLRVRWSTLEPQRGSYDWTMLDDHFARAEAAGKRVSLCISAGVSTPNWVFADGAVEFTFRDGNETVRIPVPWDPVYLDRWKALIAAAGRRYSSREALVQVKVTGIQHKSAEAGLPFDDPDVNNWLDVRDAGGARDGYTRAKVRGAWQQLMRAFSDSFPFQKVTIALGPNHFPAIDDDGNVFQSSSGGDGIIADQIVAYGKDVYGPDQGGAANVRVNQFMAQNNGLSTTWHSLDVAAAAAQVDAGYQMLWSVSNDPTGRMNGGHPYGASQAPTVLRDALDRGIRNGARFLELYPIDIDNAALNGVIGDARTRLLNAGWRR